MTDDKLISYSETLSSLSIEIATHKQYESIYKLRGNGYMGVVALLIEWTNEFEEIFKEETWEEKDWYDEIENFLENKIASFILENI